MKKHLQLDDLNKGLPFQIENFQCNEKYNSPVHFTVDGVDFKFAQKYDYARMCLNLYKQKQLGICLPKTTKYEQPTTPNAIILLDASFNLIKEFSLKEAMNYSIEKYLTPIANRSEKAFTGERISDTEVEILYKNGSRGIEKYKEEPCLEYNKRVVLWKGINKFVYTNSKADPGNLLNYWMVASNQVRYKKLAINEIKYSPYIY